MRYLQMPYINVLNVFYQLMKHVSEKVRNTGITICCFCLAAYFSLNYSALLPHFLANENRRMLFICVIFGLLAIFGLQKKLQAVSWRWPMIIIYYLFAVTILIARAHHGLATGYTLFALFLIIVLPAYALVWNNRGDYEVLFDRMALALVVVGICFYVANIIVWPYSPELFENGRYSGLTIQFNLLAMYYLCVAVSAIYLIIRFKVWVLAAVSLGISLGMIILAESRTGLLAAFAVVVVSAVFTILRWEKIKGKILYIVIAILIAIAAWKGATVAASLPIKSFSFYGVEKIQIDTDSIYKYMQLELQGQQGMAEDADGQVLLTEQGESASAPSEDIDLIGHIASAEGGKLFDRQVQKQDLNTYSSGRLAIYRWILDNSKIWGNDSDENPIVVNGAYFYGAHNTPLEFLYQCGWLSWAMCAALEIMTLITVLSITFYRQEMGTAILFAAGIHLIFFVESMLEIQTIPSYRDITCYFLMTIPFSVFLLKTDSLSGEKGTLGVN